jgi:hypothetical protein
MSYTRRYLACDVCKGRRKLWLGGGDYVECPNCHDGKVEVIAERVRARTQERFVPQAGGGLVKSTRIILPHGGSTEMRGG